MSTLPDVSFVSGIGVQSLPRDFWKETGSPEVWTPLSAVSACGSAGRAGGLSSVRKSGVRNAGFFCRLLRDVRC